MLLKDKRFLYIFYNIPFNFVNLFFFSRMLGGEELGFPSRQASPKLGNGCQGRSDSNKYGYSPDGLWVLFTRITGKLE